MIPVSTPLICRSEGAAASLWLLPVYRLIRCCISSITSALEQKLFDSIDLLQPLRLRGTLVSSLAPDDVTAARSKIPFKEKKKKKVAEEEFPASSSSSSGLLLLLLLCVAGSPQ